MPRIRRDDDIEDPTVQRFIRRRVRGWPGALAIAFGTAFCTIAGIRVIPGGLVVGSAHDLASLRVEVDTLSSYTHSADRLTDARITQDELAVSRLAGFADAVTREKCSTLGASRAKSWGYDCDGAIAPLPSRR